MFYLTDILSTVFVKKNIFVSWTTIFEIKKKYNQFWSRPVASTANGDVHETSFMYKEGSAILVPYAFVEDSRKQKRTLFSALVRTYIWFFLLAAIYKFLHDCLMFVNPYLLK